MLRGPIVELSERWHQMIITISTSWHQNDDDVASLLNVIVQKTRPLDAIVCNKSVR
jgi:hypothetical protein